MNLFNDADKTLFDENFVSLAFKENFQSKYDERIVLCIHVVCSISLLCDCINCATMMNRTVFAYVVRYSSICMFTINIAQGIQLQYHESTSNVF